MKAFTFALLATAVASSNLRSDPVLGEGADIFHTLMKDLSTSTKTSVGTASSPETKLVPNSDNQAIAAANIFGKVPKADLPPMTKEETGDVKTERDHKGSDEMPLCVASCPPEGPPSCETAHIWLENGCAASCDDDISKQLLDGIYSSEDDGYDKGPQSDMASTSPNLQSMTGMDARNDRDARTKNCHS
jgi:hypothetical protein